jgi:hypothetical protein
MNSGNGTFAWDIDVSAVTTDPINPAAITLKPLPAGADISVSGFAGSFSSGSYVGSKNDVPAGVYEVLISLTNSNGKVAQLNPVAYIYPGLSTTAAYTVTNAQFVSQVMLAGTVGITKPSTIVLTGNITVKAYKEAGRTTEIGSATVSAAAFGSGVSSAQSGEWVMAVPITNLPADKKVYFTLSVSDGTNTYTANAGDSEAIPDNGTQGLSLPLSIYGITVTPPANGTLSANKPAAVAGTSITLTATPAANYTIYPVNGTPTVTRAGDSGTESVSGSGPYTFTMPADNVTVSVVFKSSLKAITAFNITSPGTATGSVNEGAKTVTITVPGTTAVNSMTTAITLSPGATVNPAAGAGANFTTPTKTYTVSAENGTTQDYSVTVNRTVNALDLSALVTAPATGAAPNTTAINVTQYTGSISWLKNDNSAHSGNFAGAAVYKAQVSLTAKTGYTFTGVTANSFTYTGASVENDAGSGATLTVTITLPATAPAVVSDTDLALLVLAPRAGNSSTSSFPWLLPVTQYTGSIAWQTSDGTTHSGVFAASTVYKAVVSLTAQTGYTFTGLGTNAFTHTGAATVSNAAGSGATLTVTITFPVTGADKTVLQGLIDATSAGGTLTITGYNRFDIAEGPILIDKDITIQAYSGQTVTINTTGSGNFKIFKIENGKLTLGGGSGNIIFDGGAVWAGGTGNPPTPAEGASNSTGGASGREPFIEVLNGGEFIMNANVTMQNNDVTVAGGMSGAIEVVSGGTATINGGTIKNCAASKSDDSAGAIKIIGSGVLNMTGGSMSGNRGGNGITAGSVFIEGSGTFNWSGGTITNNSPSGGTLPYAGSILKNGTLNNTSGNTAN